MRVLVYDRHQDVERVLEVDWVQVKDGALEVKSQATFARILLLPESEEAAIYALKKLTQNGFYDFTHLCAEWG